MLAAFAKNLISDERGTSALEMGLICGLIVLAMISALQSFANENSALWTSVASKVSASSKAAAGG